MKRVLLAFVLTMAIVGVVRAAPVPVTVGWGKFPDVPNIAVAQQRNLWAAQDLAVEIVPFVTGREAFEALIGGQLDFVVMAEFPAVTGAMRNLKFTIPAILAEHVAFKVITADPASSTLGQLQGKRIAMPLGTNMQFVIAEALKGAGVTAELVNVSPPDMVPSLVHADVDAIVPFPNVYLSARQTLGARYGQIPLAGYSTSYLLAASEKASKTPDLSRRLLAVLLEADKVVLKDPAEAQKETAAFVGGAQSLAAIQQGWAEHKFGTKLDTATLNLMVREGVWLKQQGYVKQGESTKALFERYFATGPLKALDPAAVEID